jgi:hydrogenase nickel incorporation protein HypB
MTNTNQFSRIEEAIEDLRGLNPNSKLISLSARTDEGMDEWIQWIEDAYQKCTTQK